MLAFQRTFKVAIELAGSHKSGCHLERDQAIPQSLAVGKSGLSVFLLKADG
jgi:hypothetical protein